MKYFHRGKLCDVILRIFSFLLIGISVFAIMVSYLGSSRDFYRTVDLPYRKVALVLGTSPFLATGGKNEYYSARMEGAAELYFSGKVDRLILSGDNRDDHYNEPIKMKKSLMALGVPEGEIILDYAGRDTLDSILRARDIFGVTDPIVVTQRFHADRALYISRWNGMESVAYIVPDGESKLTRAKLAFREVFARVKMLLELIFAREVHVSGPREPIGQ